MTIFAEQDISCFTRLSDIEKSNLRRINSSIFEFNPLPDEIIYPSLGNWYDENKKISTLSQYYVRSKSEMNIANILSLKGIPFEYEKPLFAKDGYIISSGNGLNSKIEELILRKFDFSISLNLYTEP
ncbi:hypothetical protein AGMMS49940_08200 [Spirochaetia bacterium]|nr:hypothetical protein AGMMS49940_08200 [Spirochaetia bacterium]